MAAFTFEILLIVLLLIVNGVFAMSEMAVISARKARLQQWAKDGSTKARGVRAGEGAGSLPFHNSNRHNTCRHSGGRDRRDNISSETVGQSESRSIACAI
jgi:hypothetical protein